MSKTLKMAALVAMMSMVLGLMALPAMALDTVVMQGSARVCAERPTGPTGQDKPTADGCPNQIKPDDRTGPNGLYAPGGDVVDRGAGTDPSKWMNRYGNWKFESSTCSKINVVGGDTAPVPCAISANGDLGPVPPTGVGAACGVSNGYNGKGTYSANGHTATLTNVEWVTSAGSVLPVTANYSAPSGKPNKPTSGTLAGAVQANGGQPCIKSAVTGRGGASTFAVTGVFEQV